MEFHLSLDISFKKNTTNGLYIALEGVDGCGKTTQVANLKKYFENLGKQVTITSEPKVDLPGGEDLMRFFRGELEIPGQAFQYWMSANRVINQEQIVIPALIDDSVVISDRCFWSAVPYGLMDKGEGFNRKSTELMLLTQSLISQYYQFVVPDLIFYIDIESSTGLSRSLAKKQRKAVNDVYENKEKLEQVVKGYRWLIKEFPETFVNIDGEKSIDEITQEMIEHISVKLNESKH